MVRRERGGSTCAQSCLRRVSRFFSISSRAPTDRLKIKELPFTFRERQFGESKLDTLVTLDYFGLLLAKYFGDVISIRFLMFGLVGASGLVVHLLALRMFLVMGDWSSTSRRPARPLSR